MAMGGWPAVMKRNHDLCIEARNLVCSMLEIPKPCPDSMIASMATFPLPAPATTAQVDYKGFDPLQDHLFYRYNIEIPVWNWSSPPSRLIRIAVQLYNSLDQYRYFASALAELLKHDT
jgi:isopenicillin-N epimerase